MKKILLLALVVLVSGCNDARIASSNLSKAADNFELERRIVFYNGITDSYLLTIQGLCSVDVYSGQLQVTCKTGSRSFKKHYLGLSDNVTYFSEQIDSANVDVYHYRVIFKPSAIIPNIEFK